MSLYPPLEIIQAKVWTSLPEKFRFKNMSPEWAAANKPGRKIDCFWKGPALTVMAISGSQIFHMVASFAFPQAVNGHL